MPVSGRIHDNPLIDIASLGFPPGKFQGILDDPADPVEPAGFHVAAGPGDDLPDGVQMGHVGSGGLGGQGGGARVGEQVQHLRGRPAFRLGLLHEFAGILVDVFPVGGLLREDSDVLEGRQAEP